MLRRDALKVMGSTAVAVATFDGEVLSKPVPVQENKLPFKQPLGWYGYIESDVELTIKRHINAKDAINPCLPIDVGFNLSYKPYNVSKNRYHWRWMEQIWDKDLFQKQTPESNVVLIDQSKHRTIKYTLHPKPLHRSCIFHFKRTIGYHAQPVLVQFWDEGISYYKMYESKVTIYSNPNDPYGGEPSVTSSNSKSKLIITDMSDIDVADTHIWHLNLEVSEDGLISTVLENGARSKSQKTIRLFKGNKMVCMISSINMPNDGGSYPRDQPMTDWKRGDCDAEYRSADTLVSDWHRNKNKEIC